MTRWTLLAAVLACVPMRAHAQDPDAFLRWAADHRIPVTTADADSAGAGLRALSALVGGARVVAFGEPTHGAHEPQSMRNRLFRHLVEERGFTAIAIETGFTESQALARYVAGGPGELDDIVRTSFTWGFGTFAENAELVAWMRAYNADPAHTRKLRIYGIDLSGSGNGAFPDARIAVDAALDQLARRDHARAATLRTRFAPLLDRFSSDGYPVLRPEERAHLASALDALESALRRAPRSSDAEEDAWAMQNVAVARQLRAMLEVAPAPGPSPGIPPEAFRAATARDSGMAANVRWVMRQEGPQGRVMVFAHNNHVMNAPLTGGPWSAFRLPPRTMGMFLRASLGDGIVLIGTSDGGAGEGPPAGPDDGESVDAALARVSTAPFALDLRAARADAGAWAWLSRPLRLRANGGAHVIVAPAGAFDAIVSLGALTGSRASDR